MDAADPGAVSSAERHRTLAREADARGDAETAVTHLAAACAFDGDPRDWLALGERTIGDDAAHALAEAIEALEHPDLPEDEVAEVALRVAERANGLDDPVIASDALSEALRARPSDGLRRRFVRALRVAEGEAEHDGPDAYRAGRNEPCPCGSGRKFKRCHGDAAAPAAAPRSSEGTLLLRLVSPWIDVDLDDATDMLEVLRRWVPRDPAVNVIAGRIDFAQGSRDEARRHFRLAARAVERDVEVLRELLRAAIGIASQDHELAVEILELAPPGADAIAVGLAGSLALALGYPREAVPLLERSVASREEAQDRDRFRRVLARARYERGEHAQALQALEAVEDAADDDRAQAALFAAWAADASLEARCARLREDGMEEDALLAEGIGAVLAGENARAAEALQGCGHAAARHWLAEACDALGRDRQAQEARRGCADARFLGSDDLALQLDCVLALEGPAAVKARLAAAPFTGLMPLRALGRVALRLGDVREAEAAVRHLSEQAPRDVEALLLASEWHAGRGEIDAALRDVDDALTLAPRRHRVRSARAELLRQLHQPDEAQRMLEDLIRESPACWRCRIALAELLDERGDVARARDQWQAAHRAAPDVPAVARAIGRIEGEDRAFVRAREEAERSVGVLLGDAMDALAGDAQAAAVGAEQDWRELGDGDDHSTVVTQLAKAVEIELMRRLFVPFRSRGSALSDAREDVGGFGKWCRGQIPSLSLGEMAFALGALEREERSPLLDAFHVHVAAASTAPWDLGERLTMPLRTLAARRNAAVHKEPVSRAEADDSRRSVLGREDRAGLLAAIVARFPA